MSPSRMARIAGITLFTFALTPTGAHGAPTFGDPLPGMNTEELQEFLDGKEEFEEIEGIEEGLGPVFNEDGCAVCHNGPRVGSTRITGGTNQRIETRFGTVTGGQFDPLTQYGGSLAQDQAIDLTGCNISGEVAPPQATIVAGRRTQPLFGLGLVDATPENVFRQLARSQPSAVRGVVNEVFNPDTNRKEMGKFGWKAQVATLHMFSGDAYLNEMGITNPSFPMDSCPQGNCALLAVCDSAAVPDPEDNGEDVDEFTSFMTFLAPPPRGPITTQVQAGEVIFQSIGCANCHTPTLTTGTNQSAALDRVEFHPYSDFLLHDVGSLGDGIAQGNATGTLMRTQPLWGVRTQERMLHDGRATTFTQAIVAHDGQAAAARDAFAALSSEQRLRLFAFLNSL